MGRVVRHEDCSEQIGTVLEVQKNKVSVHIEQKSACVNCHSRGACSSLDKQDKVIEVITPNYNSYQKGDKVKVSITQKLGLRAVVIAFIIPFVWLMLILVASLQWWGLSEAFSCLTAILSIGVYYLFLFFLRDRIGKQFVFQITHI